MKIGIDARVLYMPVLKGIGIYLHNLLINLSEIDQKNEYILYYDTRQNLVSRFPRKSNFITKGISIRKGDRFYLWEQVRLPLETARDKIDIFHSPANTTMLLSRCPIIVTIHDVTLQETLRQANLENGYHRLLQPFILRRAKRVITPSAYSRSRIEEIMKIPKNKINVIHNGISDYFKVINNNGQIERTKREFGITGGFILSVGGESPWKNVSGLIKAYSILVKKGMINQQLVITGIRTKSILENHFDEIDKLRLQDKVLILGYIPENKLINLYNAAEVFVYQSVKEGFGFPPLEAMACGVPVIASNKSSIPEISGEAALLVDASNPDNISDAVINLLRDNSLKQRLISEGFKRVKKFTWKKTAEETLNLYEEVFKKQ